MTWSANWYIAGAAILVNRKDLVMTRAAATLTLVTALSGTVVKPAPSRLVIAEPRPEIVVKNATEGRIIVA